MPGKTRVRYVKLTLRTSQPFSAEQREIANFLKIIRI